MLIYLAMRTPSLVFASMGIALSLVCGCASNKNQSPAKTAGHCVEKGARTGVAGAKTGVLTGVEGIKAAGGAVGGYFEGGSDEASRRWEEGKAQTKKTAHEGKADTQGEANAEGCK